MAFGFRYIIHKAVIAHSNPYFINLEQEDLKNILFQVHIQW